MNLSKNLIILDLEATAGDTLKGSICEIGAVFVCKKDLVLLGEFQSLVHPISNYRDPRAMQVHGITEKELEKAPGLFEVLDNFELWIANLLKCTNLRNVMLASWGTHFDITLLRNQYKAIYRECPFHYRAFDIKTVVYWELGKMDKCSKRSGLGSVSKTLGIPFCGVRHRALDDSKQALKILQYLAMKGDKNV